MSVLVLCVSPEAEQFICDIISSDSFSLLFSLIEISLGTIFTPIFIFSSQTFLSCRSHEIFPPVHVIYQILYCYRLPHLVFIHNIKQETESETWTSQTSHQYFHLAANYFSFQQGMHCQFQLKLVTGAAQFSCQLWDLSKGIKVDIFLVKFLLSDVECL